MAMGTGIIAIRRIGAPPLPPVRMAILVACALLLSACGASLNSGLDSGSSSLVETTEAKSKEARLSGSPAQKFGPAAAVSAKAGGPSGKAAAQPSDSPSTTATSAANNFIAASLPG